MLERSFEAERRPSGRVWRRFQRLVQMPPAEIAYRAAERARIELDRRRPAAGRPTLHSSARLPTRNGSFKEYLREAAERGLAIAPLTQERAATAAWLRRDPARVDALRAGAEAALAHQVELLGFGTVDLGPGIDWHRDPLSGERWAIRFFADYDLVNGDGPDPKVVHELNRHAHILRLARAYSAFSDERYAREAVAQMLSWIDQNPVGWGVHWSSSLEIAIRTLAWMAALALLLPSPALDEPAARRIGGSLFDQLSHVDRYPSVYSSPNTHLIGEAAALFLGGTFLGALGRSFRAHGERLLARESQRQVGADGVYGELSTYYHAYALDFFLLSQAVAARTASPLAGTLRPVVERMAEFLAAVSHRDGTLPLIGDDDGGAALPITSLDYSDVRGLLSAASVACGRPDLYRAEADDRAVWLFGLGTADAMAAAAPHAESRRMAPGAFPEAGYFLQTLGCGRARARLLFDAGGMGLCGGGHAHADALQVLLDVGGRPLLVDPGTSVYNRAAAWRGYFRGTRAHNTVTVDDRDQSEPRGTFAWGHAANVHAVPPRVGPGYQYVGGVHDGYRRGPAGVIHRRHVLAAGHDYWVVADALVGQGTHRALWAYHFAADVEVTAGESDFVTSALAQAGDAGAWMAIVTSRPSTARLVEGQLAPLQGWVSSRYGARRPAPVLEVALSGLAPILALTIVRPLARPADIVVERRDHDAVVVRVSVEGAEDRIVVSDDELRWQRRGRDGASGLTVRMEGTAATVVEGA